MVTENARHIHDMMSKTRAGVWQHTQSKKDKSTDVYGEKRKEDTEAAGRTKKKKSTPTYQFFFFALPEGGGGYEDPTPPPPLRHIISFAKNPHSKSYIIKGQRICSDGY